jgi:hypothetical protein
MAVKLVYLLTRVSWSIGSWHHLTLLSRLPRVSKVLKEMPKKTDKLRGHKADPDYHSKTLTPIWKRYVLFLKIYTGLFFTMVLLTFVFSSNSIYSQYGLAALITRIWWVFIAISCATLGYFIFKVRCPKCGRYLLLGKGFQWNGECTGCGVQLKSRGMSDRAIRILGITVIILIVAVPLSALIYYLFNPG